MNSDKQTRQAQPAKTITLTPQLTEALADFCDRELTETRISALDELQGFILSLSDTAPEATLVMLRFIHQLKDSLRQLCDALPEMPA